MDMPDLEALERELERQGKTDALQRLLGSEAGRRLEKQIDARAAEAAVNSSDPAALAALLKSVLGSADGRALAQSVEALMKK